MGVLVAALLIASIGWYSTNKRYNEEREGFSTDVIRACEDLATEDRRADCADKLQELNGLLMGYQRDLQRLTTESATSTRNATGTTATSSR